MPRPVLVILVIMVLLVLLALVTPLIADMVFSQKVKKEVNLLFSDVKKKGDIVQEADLEGLPPVVQKWLKTSNVIEKEMVSAVRLKQKAVMKTEEGKAWMPTVAEQYFTVEKPGFIWKARIKAGPLLHIAGRDMYYEGKGNMLIKFLSIIPVADARGKEIDQGVLLRYLAETVWFPTAALNSYIQWEEVGPNSAKATMSCGGVTASGVFTFNDRGEPVNFTAKRYMESKGQYTLETWSVNLEDYKELNGFRIPAKGEVVWKLKAGDFSWYHFEITEIEYNSPEVYK